MKKFVNRTWARFFRRKTQQTNKQTIEETINFFDRENATVFFCAGQKADKNIIFSASQLDNKELAKALRLIANQIEFKKIKK